MSGTGCRATGQDIRIMNQAVKTVSNDASAEKGEPAVQESLPGDDPALVASGPTVPDPADAEEALRLVRDFRIDLAPKVLRQIGSTVAPLPSDPEFARNEVHVIASARLSLEAAADHAKALGIEALILSDRIEGEAKDIGRMHAALAREFKIGRRDGEPLVLLSGGETTVTIGSGGTYGRGGRNTELLLAAALDLDGTGGITALAADTDGIDGSEANAGAFCDGTTADRIRATGGDARSYLARHDAWTAFQLAEELFVTGPTGTNVNDFRAFFLGN